MPKFKIKSTHKNKLNLPFSSFLSRVKEKLSFLRWLDPFTYVDLWVMPRVKRVTKSESVEFIVNVFFALLFAWIIYSLLGFIFQTATPLVIVYSASMQNTFFRGDVIGLTKAYSSDNFGSVIILDQNVKNKRVIEFATPTYNNRQLKSIVFKTNSGEREVFPSLSGNVVVYSSFNPMSPDSGKPIIHRAIINIVAPDGNFILTKGDNSLTNPTFDQDCDSPLAGKDRCVSLYPISVNELQGKTFFLIPKLGCIKLWLVDDFVSLLLAGVLPSDFNGFC